MTVPGGPDARERAGRGTSLAGRLTRVGVSDAARAERLLADAALLRVVDEPAELLIAPLADVADPDQALLALAKLAGAVGGDAELREILRGQIERTMRLLGVRTLDELEPGHVTALKRLGSR